MKKLCVLLGLVLSLAAVLAVVGCDSLEDESTTVSLETTTSEDGQTTTTTSTEATTTTVKALSTTTTTVSSAMGALPAPTPKDKLLRGTWTWDIDADVDGAGADSDLWYRIEDELVHYLQLQNGASVARVSGRSFDAVDRTYLMGLKYGAEKLYTASVDDPDVLVEGSVIAVKTSTGQYAKIEVVGFDPQRLSDGTILPRYNLRLRYVIFPR